MPAKQQSYFSAVGVEQGSTADFGSRAVEKPSQLATGKRAFSISILLASDKTKKYPFSGFEQEVD